MRQQWSSHTVVDHVDGGQGLPIQDAWYSQATALRRVVMMMHRPSLRSFYNAVHRFFFFVKGWHTMENWAKMGKLPPTGNGKKSETYQRSYSSAIFSFSPFFAFGPICIGVPAPHDCKHRCTTRAQSYIGTHAKGSCHPWISFG